SNSVGKVRWSCYRLVGALGGRALPVFDPLILVRGICGAPQIERGIVPICWSSLVGSRITVAVSKRIFYMAKADGVAIHILDYRQHGFLKSEVGFLTRVGD